MFKNIRTGFTYAVGATLGVIATVTIIDVLKRNRNRDWSAEFQNLTGRFTGSGTEDDPIITPYEDPETDWDVTQRQAQTEAHGVYGQPADEGEGAL